MNGSHPDDELLSASLDGEAAPATATHLAGCAACRARLDALEAVRARVAAVPAAAPAGVADEAVAAAVRAWREERDARVVVPLRPAGRRRRVRGWALGAAAAAAAVALAVPIVADDDDRTDETAAAARPADAGREAAAKLDGSAVDGGDLGSLSDPSTLRQELDRAVAGIEAGAPAHPAAPEAAAEATTGDAAGDARTATPQPAPAPATSAGPDDAGGEALAGRVVPAMTAPSQDAAATACRSEVRSTYGSGLGPLLYTASLRWQGTPAVLLAYRLADTSGPGPDHRGFVMAPDGCRLLVVQGF